MHKVVVVSNKFKNVVSSSFYAENLTVARDKGQRFCPKEHTAVIYAEGKEVERIKK